MKPFQTAIKLFLLMTVLTGIIYPLSITLISQFFMPIHANGTLIEKSGKIIGSKHIAQKTPGEKYFWPRPSAIDYDPIHPSGGSNLGPSSKKLQELILERKKLVGESAPAELLYASGSGLDPHISLQTAFYQMPRVAKARSMNEDDLKKIILSKSEGRELFFFRTNYVNVLLLNEALDEH